MAISVLYSLIKCCTWLKPRGCHDSLQEAETDLAPCISPSWVKCKAKGFTLLWGAHRSHIPKRHIRGFLSLSLDLRAPHITQGIIWQVKKWFTRPRVFQFWQRPMQLHLSIILHPAPGLPNIPDWQANQLRLTVWSCLKEAAAVTFPGSNRHTVGEGDQDSWLGIKATVEGHEVPCLKMRARETRIVKCTGTNCIQSLN